METGCRIISEMSLSAFAQYSDMSEPESGAIITGLFAVSSKNRYELSNQFVVCSFFPESSRFLVSVS